MKKIALPIIMIFYIVILIYKGIEHLQSITSGPSITLEYILLGMVTILLISGIILFVKKYKLVLEGVSANDEMSKKMIHKSASFAFFTSLLLWFLVALKFEKTQVSATEMFGYGMFGMVTIFILFLTYYNIKGIRE